MADRSGIYYLVRSRRAYRLVDGEWTLGRGADVDVPVLDPQVSRVHAVLRVGSGVVEVEDHGSRNGTFVNDYRISAATQLSSGDRLRMGSTIYVLEFDKGRPDGEDWPDPQKREVVDIGFPHVEGELLDPETTMDFPGTTRTKGKLDPEE